MASLVTISAKFSRRELWAMWSAVCEHPEQPYSFALKAKLHSLISDEDRRRFRELYEQTTLYITRKGAKRGK